MHAFSVHVRACISIEDGTIAYHRRVCLQTRLAALYDGGFSLGAAGLGIAGATALLPTLKTPAMVTTEQLSILQLPHAERCKPGHK